MQSLNLQNFNPSKRPENEQQLINYWQKKRFFASYPVKTKIVYKLAGNHFVEKRLKSIHSKCF